VVCQRESHAERREDAEHYTNVVNLSCSHLHSKIGAGGIFSLSYICRPFSPRIVVRTARCAPLLPKIRHTCYRAIANEVTSMKPDALFKGVLVAVALLVMIAPTARAQGVEIGASLVSATVGFGEGNDASTLGIPSGGFGILNPGVYASFFVGERLGVLTPRSMTV